MAESRGSKSLMCLQGAIPESRRPLQFAVDCVSLAF